MPLYEVEVRIEYVDGIIVSAANEREAVDKALRKASGMHNDVIQVSEGNSIVELKPNPHR